MEKRETVDRPSATAQGDHTETARERWLDCALKDTFPASDPIASNLFD